jgi:hypothetical protein
MEQQRPIAATSFVHLEEKDLASFVSGKKVIHFKGFGPTMDTKANPPPKDLIHRLSQCDVIVFDGDDYSHESFTHVFDLLFAHTRDVQTTYPALLAFKIADEATQLIGQASSWHSFPHPLTLNYCLVDRGECQSSRLLRAVTGDTTSKVTPSQRNYVGLGVWALERVRTAHPSELQVCVWGGYQVVVCEFLCHVDLWGEKEGVQWNYWHTKRVKDGECQEGLLKDITHPILRHHLP